MEKKRKMTRVAFAAEEALNYFITIFVTGTFLGYLLSALGFSDAMQGVISTVATLSHGAQLFALAITGKRVKRTVTVAMILNQIAFITVYLLPIFNLDSGVKSAIFVCFLIVGNLLNNSVLPARLVWLMKSVDHDKRGSFTAVKEMISLAGGVVVSLALGFIADLFRSPDGTPTSEYYVICSLALIVMSVLHTVTLLVCHDSDTDEKPIPIKVAVKSLIGNKSIAKIMVIDILWQVSLGISTPFYPSYQREELAMSFTLITVISTIGLFARIAVSPIMGKIADKKSFTYSMTLCLVMQCIAYIGAIFTSVGDARWFYIVYSCFAGFAMAGMNSGFLNLVYDFVRPEDRAVAIGVKAAVGGTLGFVSTLISGFVLDEIQKAGGVKIFGRSLYAQHVLSAVSLAVLILAVVYMNKVVKKMKNIEIV